MSALVGSTAARRRPSLARLIDRYYGPIVSIAAVVAFIVLWEIAATRGWINVRFASRPSDVARAAGEVWAGDDFLMHAGVSLMEFWIGFAMALLVSLPLGLWLGTSRRARLFVEPPLMALYTAPRLALLPILIVWLGIGMASKVAIVFLGAVFPMLVNTMAGVRDADYRLIQAARAFGATRLDIFRHVLVPGALPAILAGIRLGVGRGLLSVIVGEMFVSEAGIGHQLMTYGQAMQTDRLIVYAVAVGVFGYALTLAVRLVEDHIRSWKPST